MIKLWGEEEIKKAKADKSIRDKIKAEFEERIGIGKPRYYSVDAEESWYKLEHRVVTEDAIRQFCDGIGDVNPLYRSRDYAKNSVYGEIIAPPTFLNALSTFNWKAVTGMTDFDYTVAGFDAGATVEWFKAIRLGDEFTIVEIPTKIIDLTREGTAVQFLCCADKIYRNQRDEVVAVVNATVVHMVVSPPRETEIRELKVRHFSEQEVEEWYRLMEQDEIRGAEPRFWEDVNVGDQLPPTHRVFDMMETVAFSVGVGWGGSWRFSMARGDAWKSQRDPESGLPDFSGPGPHLTDTAARRAGLPRAVAQGVQMDCWLCHMITNWMGDTGFLKRLSFQVRRSLYRDSLALCKGEVVKKYVENDEHRVDLKVELEDHNGGLPVPNASATVVLPSRCLENWRSQVVLPSIDPF